MKPDFRKMGGLLPAVVQDAGDGRVLMVGYMDAAALAKTRKTGKVTFFSRSKARLWTKGESSGNYLKLVSIALDCDGDALLVRARPAGPACHSGARSCFDAPADFLKDLDALIAERRRKKPRGSYTTALFAAGLDRIAQKVGEEAVETALAAQNRNREKFLGEAADLAFHLLVLLRARGASLDDLGAALRARHAVRVSRARKRRS